MKNVPGFLCKSFLLNRDEAAATNWNGHLTLTFSSVPIDFSFGVFANYFSAATCNTYMSAV